VITIPIISNWNICTPIVYRYLLSQFVDDFFRDGSIRLSTFERFSKHADEERLDDKEGKTFFVHRTQVNGGQTITAHATHGSRAYILSTSTIMNLELMNIFNSDSYIQINDTTQFGISIFKCLSNAISGFEGFCIYQNNRIIERNLGYINLNLFKRHETSNKLDKKKIDEFINSRMLHYPYFIKRTSFKHQFEYRVVWIVSALQNDFIDLKVPEARRYCSEPSDIKNIKDK